VIAQQLKELSKGRLILENPDELTNTNTILRAMGLNQKQRPKGNFKKNNNNNKKKFIKK
jgi:hypothetical protein